MTMANEVPLLEDEMRAAVAIGTRQLLERAVLLLFFAGLLIGVLAVLRPFATAILFGTILAIAAWPLRDFLLRRGLKRGPAATLLLLLALAVVVLPLLAVAPGLAERLTLGASRLRTISPALRRSCQACRLADRRRTPCQRLGQDAGRRGRRPNRARTLL